MSDFTDIQRGIETKGRRLIRRVRTPEGADHFGQPIGSIIVRDLPSIDFSVGGHRQSTRVARTPNQPRESPIAAMGTPDTPVAEARKAPEVEEVPTDYEGTRKWKVPGRRGRVYTWEEGPDKWVLADHKDEVLAEDTTEAGVIGAIQRFVKRPATGAPKATRQRKKKFQRRIATDEELQMVYEKHKIKFTPQYRDSTTIVDSDDWLDQNPVLSWTDKGGKVQSAYTAAHKEAQARAKFQRVKKLSENIDKLDEYLQENWRTDDAAAALYLMRKTGIRPSSMNNNTGKEATFGVTNLQARHVTLNKDSVRLKFIGKKIVKQDHTYKDPELFEMFTQYSEGKTGREEIFPGADEHKLRAIMKGVMGGEYKVYDLRTLLATQYALQLVAAKKRPAAPKTSAEFKRWRNEVGDAVSDALGNDRKEALDSYIDPEVFRKWEEAVSND